MMRIAIGILLGFILGWIATSAATLTFGTLAGVSQAEGAFAMGTMFLTGPLGGIAGAVAGGILGTRWARRSRV